MTRLRIISYNIRYNNPADRHNAWPNRRQAVVDLLRRHDPDLIGFQEVTHRQLNDLAGGLPAYGWVGVGRDDGATAGEYVPIFYRRERFTLAESGHFWLSATPDVAGSLGWDAACIRVTTWARLTDHATGATLLHVNTHFDHRGLQAQLASARLLYHFLAQQAPATPALITGDFNCEPDSVTYKALLADPTLTDAMQVSRTPPEGPAATFTTDFADPLQAKIDYLLLYTPPATTQWTVHRHAILADQHQGYYPSDHLPLLAEVA